MSELLKSLNWFSKYSYVLSYFQRYSNIPPLYSQLLLNCRQNGILCQMFGSFMNFLPNMVDWKSSCMIVSWMLLFIKSLMSWWSQNLSFLCSIKRGNVLRFAWWLTELLRSVCCLPADCSTTEKKHITRGWLLSPISPAQSASVYSAITAQVISLYSRPCLLVPFRYHNILFTAVWTWMFFGGIATI